MERYKCDRGGGFRKAYERVKPWTCPYCGWEQRFSGHRCQDCRRRICCDCFHHDLVICLGGPGTDVPALAPPKPMETCQVAIERRVMRATPKGERRS